jgi:predicted PurR-regulated permease PerM
VSDAAATRPRTGYGVLIAAIFAALLLFFVYSVARVLLLLFIAALFSLYLGAITEFLRRRLKVPRGIGLAIALLITFAGVAGVGWLIVPPVLEQMQGLLGTLPTLITLWQQNLTEYLSRFPVLAGSVPAPGGEGGYLAGMIAGVGGYFAGLFPYLFSGLHVVIDVFSVMVMGIYMTLRPTLYREGAVALAPPVHRELVRDIFAELGRTIAMTVLGVLTYIGLLILDVPYALAFGVLTAAVAIIPFFGTLVSTLLPALFVLPSGGPTQALLVLLLGVIVHLLEANFIIPIILDRQIHLPPVLS